jgi:sugar phosphate isomerase/epimerase
MGTLTAMLAVSLLAGPTGLPNAFYAMDTCTKRPYPRNDITPAQQFDMLKGLGYAGIAWTEEPAGQVTVAAKEAEARGLKMFAIYCSATVNAEGQLKPSPLIEPIMDALRGHDTIVWLHIGGRGPRIDELTPSSPVVEQLRALAARAERNGLGIAVYPHVGDWTERLSDAVGLARLVDRKNFGVTFNLCHSLAMGDEQRIPRLLEDAAPFLMTVTINGADTNVKGPQWNRLIQTLDRGSYDVGIVLRTLEKIRFRGPIGLQGYGLGGDRSENLKRSMEGWQKLAVATPHRAGPAR